MAHFAKLNSNNTVTTVTVVDNDALDSNNEEQSGAELLNNIYGTNDIWKQTSYDRSFRKNSAGVDYTYDATRDAFIPPKCHNGATLNESTCCWDCTNSEHNTIS